jgi:hypothetical protein
MPKATVICPTFNHQDTLYASLASIEQQVFSDFEVVVIGDGAPDRTAEIVQSFIDRDCRFRYQWHPKCDGRGEPHRDRVIAESKSDLIAYIADDDVWFPHHLGWLVSQLESVEFAHTLRLVAHLDGALSSPLYNASQPELWALQAGTRAFAFGLSNVAHRVDAYLALPEGWQNAPPGTPSDQFMWTKFARAGVRAGSVLLPSCVHLANDERKHLDPESRRTEMMQWCELNPDHQGVIDLALRTSYVAHVEQFLAPVFPTVHDCGALLTAMGIEARDIGSDASDSSPATPHNCTVHAPAGVVYLTQRQKDQISRVLEWRNGALDDEGYLHSLLEARTAGTASTHERIMTAERLLARQRFRAALEVLTDGYRAARSVTQYVICMLRAMIGLKQFEGAQRIVDMEVHRLHDHYGFTCCRAQIRTGLGDDQLANQLLAEAIEMSPSSFWAYHLAMILNSKDSDTLRRVLQRAFDHIDDFGVAQKRVLATHLKRADQPAKALAIYERLIDSGVNDKELLEACIEMKRAIGG